MPKKGIRYPKYCLYTVGQNTDGAETETYSTGKVAGKAVGADITINAESVDFYSDDSISETVTEFTSGTIKFESDDLIDSVSSELLGRTIDASGMLIANAEDNPPYVKFGFVAPKVLNKHNLFRTIIIPRVSFAPPSENFSTKGKTVTLTGTTLNGTIAKNKDGDYWKEKTFDTELAALACLNAELHIPSFPPPALTVAFSPADEETAVTADSNIILTFSNSIDHGGVSITTASGLAVASTKTFNGGKNVLTIDPVSNLTAGTTYIVSTAGIVDAYGQELADTAINFTVA